MNEKEFQEKANKLASEIDTRQRKYLEDRKDFLLREKVLKKELGIVPIEPKFEYEKSKKWQEHLYNGFELAVEEDLIRIQNTLNELEIKEMQRQLREEKNNDRDY